MTASVCRFSRLYCYIEWRPRKSTRAGGFSWHFRREVLGFLVVIGLDFQRVRERALEEWSRGRSVSPQFLCASSCVGRRSRSNRNSYNNSYLSSCEQFKVMAS
jgi:hypothetical protein